MAEVDEISLEDLEAAAAVYDRVVRGMVDDDFLGRYGPYNVGPHNGLWMDDEVWVCSHIHPPQRGVVSHFILDGLYMWVWVGYTLRLFFSVRGAFATSDQQTWVTKEL
jgi:hypothetical protein